MYLVSKTKYANNSFPESSWYHFSAYQIRDRTIRPRPGAYLDEYNPWDLYQKTMTKRRTVQTPYSEFLELGRRLEPVYGDLITKELPAELARVIERWCSRWGYPGVLPSTAVDITLPPRIPPPEKESTIARSRSIRSTGPEPTQTRYFRFGGEWMYQVKIRVSLPADEPRLVFWRWYDRKWEATDISRLGRFFPTLKATQDYPQPGTPEFHKVYAEPVLEFALTCVRFFQTARVVSRYLRGQSPLMPDMRESPEFVLNEAMANLMSLEQGMGPSCTLEKNGGLSIRNESVSLLCSFAGMLLMDLSRGRRVIECDRCGTVFISDNKLARFCSPTCRKNAASNRFRAHKRVKKTLRPSRRTRQ